MGPSLQLSRGGKIIGVFDLQKLRMMKAEGRILPGDYVWMTGWADWKDALSYLGEQQAPAKTEEAPKPKRPRPKIRRQTKEAADEAIDADSPEEPDTSPEEEKAIKRNAMADKIGAFLFVVTLVLIFMGYGGSKHTRHPRTTAQAKATKEQSAQPKTAEADQTNRRQAETTGAAATTTRPTRPNYGFKGFGYDGKDLFASSVIAYAGVTSETPDDDSPDDAATFYCEGTPYAAIAISGVKKGDRFRVTVTGDRFIRSSKFEFVAKQDDDYIEAGPNTLLDFEALSRLRQSVPFNVTYTVQRGDEPPRSESETWIAHQINDCQTGCANFYLTNKGKIRPKPFNSTYSFAGYVNENHPWIDVLLKEALGTGLCSAFSGYQEGEEGVHNQVNAIWSALQRRGISYSNIATSTVSGNNSYQHVRFIDESITSSQANCIDGSVVLASLLRKIGLNVSIILVPRHAYVAVLKEDGSEYLFAIETTMIGATDLSKAIDYATESGPESLDKIYDKLADEKNETHQEINILEARKTGINPIPFTR